MRIRSKHLAALAVAGAAALGATAPDASAQTVCQSIGKDQADPLRSTVCAGVERSGDAYVVSVGCEFFEFVACAVDPVVVDLTPTP